MNQLSLEAEKTEVAIEIFKCGAFLDQARSPYGKGFKLKMHQNHPDAPLSPYYVNLRTSDNPKPGPITPVIMAKIGRLFWKYVCDPSTKIEFKHVAGIPNAGDPFAAALALIPKQPLSRIRLLKEEFEGGRRVSCIIDGKYSRGDCVLLVDDLINRANSKLEARHVLGGVGLINRDVLVLVDREQGGREELAKFGVNLHAMFMISEFLGIYVQKGLVSPSFRHKVLVEYPEELQKYFSQIQAGQTSV